MANNWKKGVYTLKNPDKYLGDVDNVVFRSSWEEEAFKILDNNPKILAWASEEIKIPYAKPLPDGNYARSVYTPDLFIVKEEVDGTITRQLIEIKPHKQTQPSKARKPLVKLKEQYEYAVNQHKWHAAEKWCEKYGIIFSIVTEKDMFV